MKVCIALLFSLIIHDSFAQSFLFGKKHTRIIHAIHLDSVIYIEKMERFKGSFWADFDTLRLAKDQFRGKHFKVKKKQDQLIFFPGRIILEKQDPVDTLFRLRNTAFINSYKEMIDKQINWTQMNPWVILQPLLSDSALMSSNPDSTYKIITTKAQSSRKKMVEAHWQIFDSVSITNDRIISKKRYTHTSDSAMIREIWEHLSIVSSIKDKSMAEFYLQFYPIYLAYGIYQPLLFIIPIPALLTYGVLLLTENFIINRIYSRRTYVVKFYCASKTLKLKVRKNSIINSGYKYQLQDNFASLL